MTTPDKAPHLDALARAVEVFEAARDALEAAVRAARDHGATWAEIGTLLGVSRQAAFQRYGPKEPRPDRDDAGA